MRGVYGSRAGLGQVLGLLEASEENDKREMQKWGAVKNEGADL